MSPAQEGTPIKKAPDAKKKKISGVLVKPCFASFFALLFNIRLRLRLRLVLFPCLLRRSSAFERGATVTVWISV